MASKLVKFDHQIWSITRRPSPRVRPSCISIALKDILCNMPKLKYLPLLSEMKHIWHGDSYSMLFLDLCISQSYNLVTNNKCLVLMTKMGHESNQIISSIISTETKQTKFPFQSTTFNFFVSWILLPNVPCPARAVTSGYIWAILKQLYMCPVPEPLGRSPVFQTMTWKTKVGTPVMCKTPYSIPLESDWSNPHVSMKTMV